MSMDKIAIMGDVHANPSALAAALGDARALGCSRFWFLGDITGYGYDLKEALKMVRENFEVVLRGNHDVVCSDVFPSGLGNRNYDIDRLQAGQLSESELEYLRGLPLVHAEDGVACVHGDFTNPRGFRYIQDAGDALDNRYTRDEQLLFCAHLHLASVWQVEDDATVTRLTEPFARPVLVPETVTCQLRPDCHYVINCGSVGYPRIERSIVYSILDRKEKTVSIRRLPFDVEAYRRDMIRAGIAIPAWL